MSIPVAIALTSTLVGAAAAIVNGRNGRLVVLLLFGWMLRDHDLVAELLRKDAERREPDRGAGVPEDGQECHRGWSRWKR